MKRPKQPEQLFFKAVEMAQAAAAAHQKSTLVTVYPSQPWRSAVVAVFVTCPDKVMDEIAGNIKKAVDEVFARHSLSAN